VKVEKMPCASISFNDDQSSPFWSPSPFLSGDALPLFDPLELDLDLLESPFSLAGDPDRDFESLLDFFASLSLLSPLLGDLFVLDLDRDLDFDFDLDFDLLLRLLDRDLEAFFPLRLRDLDLDLESLLLDLERDLDLRDFDLERRERDLLLLLLLLLDLDLDFLPPPLLSSVNLIRRPFRS